MSSLHRFASLVEKSLRKPLKPSKRRKADRNRYAVEELEAIRFADQGLLAYFFLDMNLSVLGLTRVDQAINFDWGQGSPDVLIPADGFSARWAGVLTAPESGDYTLSVTANEGVRLIVDGQTVIDRRSDLTYQPLFDLNGDETITRADYDIARSYSGQVGANLPGDVDGDGDVDGQDLAAFRPWLNTSMSPETDTATIHFEAGSSHFIQLDFYDKDGLASVQLSWATPSSSGGGGGTSPIAAAQFSTSPTAAAPQGAGGSEGSTVSVSTAYVDPVGSGLSASVDWGDPYSPGTDTNVTLTPASGNPHNGTLSASHAYADDGVYSASLTLTGPSGTTITPFTVTVANANPTGSITAPATAHVGDPVTLSFDDPQDAPGDAGSLTYRFDLDGDGTYETDGGSNPSYRTTFSTTGIHTVGGQITDKDGGHVESTASINVGAPVTTPPALMQVTGSATSLSLKWPTPPTGGDQYVLQYSTSPDFAGATTVNVSGTSSWSSPNTLTPATPYFVRVAQTNSGGPSDWSPTQIFLTQPKWQTASATAGSIGLSWSAAGSPDVGFTLERIPTALRASLYGTDTSDIEFAKVADFPGTSTGYSDTAVINGANYTYRLTATYNGVTSFAIYSDRTIPTAPSLSATMSTSAGNGTNFVLTWTNNSPGSPPLTIEQSSDGGTTWQRLPLSQSYGGVPNNVPQQGIVLVYPNYPMTYRAVAAWGTTRASAASSPITLTAPTNVGGQPLPVIQGGGFGAIDESATSLDFSYSSLGQVPFTLYFDPPTGDLVPFLASTFPTSVSSSGQTYTHVTVPLSPLADDDTPNPDRFLFALVAPSPSYLIDTQFMGVTGYRMVDDDWVDLDIDSNNNDGTGLQRGTAEDAIEDDPTLPGKILPVNDGDADGDNVPDYADGYGLAGLPATSAGTINDGATAALVLNLPTPAHPAGTVPKIRFTYDASDPAAVMIGGTTDAPTYELPDTGSLRLWTKRGLSDLRNPADVAHGGNFIASGVEYTPSQLGYSASDRTFYFGVEAVKPSTAAGDRRIQVEVDPDGDGPKGWVLTDAVRLTAITTQLVEADDDGSGTHPATSFTSSNPTPTVTLSYYQIQNVHASSDGKTLYGDVYVEGSVASAVADVTAGDLGTINSVDVYLNDAVLPIGTVGSGSGMTVSKSDYTPSFTKPYAYSGQFAKTFTNVPLQPGQNTVTVTASEKVYGATGYASSSIDLHVSPGVPVLGEPDFSASTFSADPAVPAGHSDAGEFHRYLYQVVGPDDALQQMPYIQTPFGARAVKKASDLKYYVAPNMQATYKAAGLPGAEMFRLKAGTPTLIVLGNGMTEVDYEYEKRTDLYTYVDGVDGARIPMKSGEQWDSLGVNKLVVPSGQAVAWAKYVKQLADVLNTNAEWKDAKGDAAFLEGALRAVPFGTLAADINDGDVGWSTAKSTFIDAALTFTPMAMARPIRAAGTIIATADVVAERGVVGEYSSLLTGGSTDVATSFANPSSVVDGSFTNLGNPRIATLPTANVTVSGGGVALRTSTDAISVNVTEYNGFWQNVTPADLTLTRRATETAENIASTFKGGQFTPQVLSEDHVFYRLYGKWPADAPPGLAGKGGYMVGRFLATTNYATAAEARQALALLPEWNATTRVAKVVLPRGTIIFTGPTAEQVSQVTGEVFLGGGEQAFVPDEFLLSSFFTDIGPIAP